MTDDKEYYFDDLPLKVQQEIVNSTDPYAIYNEDWFDAEYYNQWFSEILKERLGEGTDINLNFEEPSQGSMYAYISSSMSFDNDELISFVETAKLGHQNGIINQSILFKPIDWRGEKIYSKMNQADILAYMKYVILPMLKSTEELQEKTATPVPILQFGLEIDTFNTHSGKFSTYSGGINIIDFEMEYTCFDSGGWITTELFVAPYGYWSNELTPEKTADQDSAYEAIEFQVKPIYEFLENEFVPIFKKWLVEDVLDYLSDGVNRDNDWQTSKEAIEQYLENAEKTYNIEGEEL